MALPAGYFYKDGAYWFRDGTGPYKYDGASMSILALSVETAIPAASPIQYLDGNVFNPLNGAGPTTHTG